MPSPRWSPHGSLIAYLEGTGSPSPGIYIVREGRSPRRIVPLAQTTEWPQVERTINWSADGTLVAYDTHGAAFEVDVKTGRRRTLDATQARFAPDGRDMLLLAEAKASAATGIYRARLIFLSAGRHRRIPIADGVMGDLFAYIDWSPDGTQAAFLKQNGLWIADLPARTTHQVLRWNLPGTQYKGPLIWARPGIP